MASCLTNPVYKEDFNGGGKGDKVQIILRNKEKSITFIQKIEIKIWKKRILSSILTSCQIKW